MNIRDAHSLIGKLQTRSSDARRSALKAALRFFLG